MSDYTYDRRQDEQGFENLTGAQRELGNNINATAQETGADRHVLLVNVDAASEDKAALAEVWGGPGAGAEFQS